jgi:hypothetical protein
MQMKMAENRPGARPSAGQGSMGTGRQAGPIGPLLIVSRSASTAATDPVQPMQSHGAEHAARRTPVI